MLGDGPSKADIGDTAAASQYTVQGPIALQSKPQGLLLQQDLVLTILKSSTVTLARIGRTHQAGRQVCVSAHMDSVVPGFKAPKIYRAAQHGICSNLVALSLGGAGHCAPCSTDNGHLCDTPLEFQPRDRCQRPDGVRF